MSMRFLSARLTDAASKTDSRSFDVVASTEVLNRNGYVVKQDWKLDGFLKNPVILWAHDASSLPIGKASNVRVEDNALRMTVTLADHPAADAVFQAVKAGLVNAISVGFRSSNAKYEKHDGKEVLVLSGNDLLEASLVPVPANPDALIMQDALAGPSFAAVCALTLTTSPDDAVAVLRTWKTSHETLPSVQAEVASLKAAQVTSEKNSIVAELRRTGKATLAQESFLRGLELDKLKEYAACAPVVLNTTPTQEPKTEPVLNSFEGKTFEDLVKTDDYGALHRLGQQNEDLYRAVMAARKH